MTDRKPLLKRLIMPDLYPAPAAGAAVQSVELSVFADKGHGCISYKLVNVKVAYIKRDSIVTKLV